ncbi:hypothetical protein Syun_020113 [Stephania yunnanensis]|uniref:EXPERA domain-containing protein n=1 Tax=Stephania yunnanensis TaxID=152371 RepID=A0AAP0IDB9_9MAGN
MAHPYIPSDLSLPGYVPSSLSPFTIVAVYLLSSLFVATTIWLISGKEYSKGDSRYAARDAGVVTVEGITAVLEGPASLLLVYAIAKRAAYREVLQLAISLGQLYGTAVYFITAILEGDNFASSTYHYFAYYVFANSFWILIPSLIIVRSWKKICAATEAQVQKKAKAL